MKLLMTLSRIPYPLEKGDKLRAYHQIKEFLSQGISLTVVCFHFEKLQHDQKNHLESLGGEWHFIQLDKWRVPFQFLRIIWTKLPLQVILFYNQKAHKRFKEILVNGQPDHLYAQLIRTAEYVKEETNFDKTLDYMDSFSAGLKRRAKHAPWYERWLYEWEYEKVKRYEHGVYHYFDHHTIISKTDAENTGIPHFIDIVSNGIDASFIDAPTLSEYPNAVVFTGNMGYPPNVEAALRLGKKIMPLVWHHCPETPLIIAGAEPHRTILSQLSDPRIHITGWLPDIKSAYQQGKVFVAPMTLGSGMQNKIIEALAMGKSVICSPLVAKAFDPEVQLLLDIQMDDVQFTEAIIKHLSPDFSFDVQHSKLIVQKYFSWSKTSQQLLQLFHS
jgi:polysaccharide biosynthesis protein PslH